MSEDASPRLGLPYLAGGQLQKHVTLNAALSRLDALIHLSAVSRSVADQPVDPADGAAWILPEDADGGDWSLMARGGVAVFLDGVWQQIAAPIGTQAFVADEGVVVVRAEDGWVSLGSKLGRIDYVDRLGIGAAPDDANPLTARLNGALLAARPTDEGGTGDVRIALNKQATAGVASLLLQTGYGGRAEIGLVGDDRLALRVSANGTDWHEGLGIDPADGRVTVTRGALRRETTVFTASGSFAPPAWARRIEALVIGAGGGGGGGQGGATGTLRMGGGGGGAGGLAQAVWTAEALTGAITVTLGTGGVGGMTGAAGGEGGHAAVRLDGVILLRAFGGGGGAATGAPGVGGLAGRSGNGGGPSVAAGAGSGGAASTSPENAGGGGGGGAVTAADVAQNGGPGGQGGVMAVAAAGGAGGAGASGGGGAAAPLPALCRAGGGGGGGGGSSSGPGHAGGGGGQWGAGGGGGGAGLVTGGAGGAGAPGLVVLTAVG